jgi:FKBP-type peptidyl-prolyl cis-trans isomerase
MKTLFTCLIALLVSAAGAGASPADNGFVSSASGLASKDLRVGSGAAAQPGATVVVHFVGWLSDEGRQGREIFNSRRDGQPVSFVVGTEKVMRGWSEGVTGMRVGGTRLVRVPPELGYGDRAVEDLIPPRSPLLFLLELLEVR